MPRDLVALVLGEEIKRGRVLRVDGGYRLVEKRFDPDVLDALRGTVRSTRTTHGLRGEPGSALGARRLARSFS